DSAFFLDVIGFPSVDAREGWLIFAMPRGEMRVHPDDGKEKHELYLMCDDVNKTVAELKAKGVALTRDIKDEGWGLVTGIILPSGGELGLYEPIHLTAVNAK